MTNRSNEQWKAAAESVLIQTYRQQPVAFHRGKGCQLWDAEGKEYLDMTAGISVLCLGHSHPVWVERVGEQLRNLVHTSNLYCVEQQLLAAEKLVEKSFADRAFFCNSGAEANEAALKLARRYQSLVRGDDSRQGFVATHGSFHGRSMGTVAVTGQDKYRDHFGKLVAPIEFVDFGDLDAARVVLEKCQAAAIIVEPVQAEGGIVVPPEGYLAGLREACDATDTLLIFDEVQTGMGRLGTWFGYQHDGVEPDVMSLAKGLGGGIAVGAVVASEKAAQGLAIKPAGAVPHASTFGGNPLSCSAIVATMDILEQEDLISRCVSMGEHLGKGLAALCDKYEFCLEARGRGLLRGIALEFPAGEVTGPALEQGVLLSVAGGTVVRFAPPFVVREEQIDRSLEVVDNILAKR